MCAGGEDGLQTHQSHGRERGLRPSKGLCFPRETVSHGDHGEHGMQAARQKEGRKKKEGASGDCHGYSCKSTRSRTLKQGL